MGLAPFPMEERVGLYENSSNKSIAGKCINDVVKIQTSGKKATYAEIVLKNKFKR